MRIQELAGKKVCILGFGREGRAMAEALTKNAPGCSITVADRNADIDVPEGLSKHIGEKWLTGLESFDVLIKSPGIPPLPELVPYANTMTSPTQIFLDTIDGSGALVIGITGSKGKSTTSALLYEILKAAGKDVYLVGNIGEPAIKHLADAKKDTIFVHEMSSYQLMGLTKAPHIAVVTAFFPEHLDYHGSLEAYKEAKSQIARAQTKDDVLFYNRDSKEAKEIAHLSPGKKIPFGASDAPVRAEDISLKGEHNLGNIAAAVAVSAHLGVKKDIAIRAAREFRGLPHRLESLGVHGGIEWVNDSISTTPESAIAALDALGDRVTVLILGGQDRGYDFRPLAKRIANSSLKNVVLLPDSGDVIGKAIEHAGAAVILSYAETMEDAVKNAREAATDATKDESIPVVLLSPAAPSYGHFRNFEDRGEQFRKNVQKI